MFLLEVTRDMCPTPIMRKSDHQSLHVITNGDRIYVLLNNGISFPSGNLELKAASQNYLLDHLFDP